MCGRVSRRDCNERGAPSTKSGFPEPIAVTLIPPGVIISPEPFLLVASSTMFKSKDESHDSVDEPLGSSLGKLLLRCTVGGLMLFHGIHKLKHGVGGIEETLGEAGLPTLMAYGVYVGEVVAPVLMILGWLTRPAAVVLVFTMIMAIGLEHRADLTQIGPFGQWAVEVPMFYLLTGAAVFALGPGNLAIGRKTGLLA